MSIQAKKMTPKSRGYNLIRTLLVVYGLIVFLARLDHIFRPTHVLGLITNKYGLVNQQPLIILLLLLEFSTSKKKIFIKMDSPCDKWPLFDNNYAYSKPIYTF